MVQIDQELEVYILTSTRRRRRSPWASSRRRPARGQTSRTKYPVGSRHTGEVVNVMSYGAFVKLEPGIEGLVHISEMTLDQAHQPSQRAGQPSATRSRCRS